MHDRPPSHQSGAFDFGRNWRTYVDAHLSDERIERAQHSLVEFLRLDDLKGRTFLDIGCGSGLFSLSAHRLGAERVVSFDVNPRSVACCRELWNREGRPEGWRIAQGSVLDRAFVESLGTYDVVYSWGVLHHTGAMWDAILAAAGCVAPGGLLYIAIYNRADGLGPHSDGRLGSSRFWAKEKRFYVGLPSWAQRCLDVTAAAAMVLVYLLRLRNPAREIRSHRNLRGMSWMVDIRDWLGGYPYEYATVAEVFRVVRERTGFLLENLSSTNSLMNNEFLFRRGG